MPSYVHAIPAPAAVPRELPRIAYILSVYCACQKQIRLCVSAVRLGGTANIAAAGFGGAKGPDPAGEEVLYLTRIEHWVQSENNVHVKRRLDPGHAKIYQKINSNISKVRSFYLQTHAL